jgi:hypothetical protein
MELAEFARRSSNMTKSLQIYYNAAFGALGGLIAWWLVGLLPTATWNLWLATAFIGVGAGLFIGGAVGAVDGAVTKRSLPRTLIGLVLGGLAGLVSGVAGLLIGQAGFLITGGGFLGRTLGWTMLGLFLGIGEGAVERKLKRAAYGLVGGAVAGVIGGLIYEGLTQAFLQRSGEVQVWLGALGLALIGASLGGITALAVEAIARVIDKGVLVVKSGSRAGTEVRVVDHARLGSYDGCEVYLPGGRSVEKEHAVVIKRAEGFYVMPSPKAPGASTLINQHQLAPGGQKLNNGDAITMGDVTVVFEAR